MAKKFLLFSLLLFILNWAKPALVLANEVPQATGVFGMVRYPDLIQGLKYLEEAISQKQVIEPEEVESLKKIFRSKVWVKVIEDSQKLHEVEHLVQNLVLNSTDLEKDYRIFHTIGLTEVPNLYFDRLIKKTPPSEAGERSKYSSLFLLARQPLRSFPLSSGAGKSAQELNLKYLFHSVSENSDALKSLTQSKDGRLNALISSPYNSKNKAQSIGQSTLIGEGFYTSVMPSIEFPDQMGIGLKIDPNARDGSDFIITRMNEDISYLRVLNKNAVKIVKINYGKISCSMVLSTK